MSRRGLDRPLLGTTALLILLGLLTLYSAGQTDAPSAVEHVWRRQLAMLALGVGGALVAFRTSPRLLEWATPLLYGGAVVLLLVTLFLGTGPAAVGGAKSWLVLGGVRLGQPAEFAKLATILMLARHLGGRRRPPQGLADLLPPVCVVGIPFLLVGLQPDLGSAIVYLGILFAMLFWGGVRGWWLLFLASPLISLLLAFSTLAWSAWMVVITLLLLRVRPYAFEAVVVWLANVLMGVIAIELWERLAPYQQNRLLSFLNPEIDPRATGWHIIQSKVAIGSGGLLGKGLFEGTQKRLEFLPAQHTDFIFSVVGEELGFVGVLLCLALFAGFVLVLLRVARQATDAYSSLLVFGFAAMSLTHILVNVGMTVGVMPITGIPLPFFSYGGSFLVTSCVGVGLALRVAWEARGGGYGGRAT